MKQIIYLLVFLSIGLPIGFGVTMPAAKMEKASALYREIEEVKETPKPFVLLSLDFGPGSGAENAPQAEVIIEHLFRARIPFAVMTMYAQGQPFLSQIPHRIAQKLHDKEGLPLPIYGTDWVNLGYKTGNGLFLQALAKADSLTEFLGKDAESSRPLKDLAATKDLRTLKDISLVGEFTGLTGIFDGYVQFLQRDGYSPKLVHGCTSITIPEAYIYLDSGQLVGLLEGVSGAAWYGELLNEKSPKRGIDSAARINTALGVSQLLLLALIIAGNILSKRSV